MPVSAWNVEIARGLHAISTISSTITRIITQGRCRHLVTPTQNCLLSDWRRECMGQTAPAAHLPVITPGFCYTKHCIVLVLPIGQGRQAVMMACGSRAAA